jgi:hypothetical protein
MNWEQKLAALNALAECELRMRCPGDWYVLQSDVQICDGYFETGGRGVGSQKRYVRWNGGFMWRDVEKPT